MKIFCKFPTINILKLFFLLVICIVKGFVFVYSFFLFSLFFLYFITTALWFDALYGLIKKEEKKISDRKICAHTSKNQMISDMRSEVPIWIKWFANPHLSPDLNQMICDT